MERPKIAQKSPYVMDMQPGTYFWCACGQSSKQPFCDGSHKGTGFKLQKANQQSYGWLKSFALLFSGEGLKDDFSSLSELKIWEEDIELGEGQFHEGEAAVIRLIGKK